MRRLCFLSKFLNTNDEHLNISYGVFALSFRVSVLLAIFKVKKVASSQQHVWKNKSELQRIVARSQFNKKQLALITHQ